MAGDGGTPWNAVFDGLAAAIIPTILIQGMAWWKGRKRVRQAASEERSGVAIARLNNDANANDRLITHLTTQLAQRETDCDELMKERENLQERNTRLARRYALADANIRILTATLQANHIAMPTLAVFDEESYLPQN